MVRGALPGGRVHFAIIRQFGSLQANMGAQCITGRCSARVYLFYSLNLYQYSTVKLAYNGHGCKKQPDVNDTFPGLIVKTDASFFGHYENRM